MLRHPVLSPTPAVARNTGTGNIVMNHGGKTRIVFEEVFGESGNRYWQITIKRHEIIRATTTSIGTLAHAVFHAIQACTTIGLLQPPPGVRRKWYARKFWRVVSPGVYPVAQLGCRCGPSCMVHRPLLTVSKLSEGRYLAVCLGKSHVTNDTFALAQFVAEQLVQKRYLR